MGNLALKQSGIGTLINGNKSYGIVTGTISGLRISNVAGAYFLDNCAALLPYSGCRVRFKDSGGKYFDCTMGLRGVSEGLGDELLIEWTNYSFWPYETLSLSGTDIIQAINTTTYALLYKLGEVQSLCLYKIINENYVLTSGQAPLFGFGNGTNMSPLFTKGGITYSTCVSPNRILQFFSSLPTEFSATGNSLKQVLTPSNQGLLLTAAPTVDSGFTYNAASYTYEVWS